MPPEERMLYHAFTDVIQEQIVPYQENHYIIQNDNVNQWRKQLEALVICFHIKLLI